MTILSRGRVQADDLAEIAALEAQDRKADAFERIRSLLHNKRYRVDGWLHYADMLTRAFQHDAALTAVKTAIQESGGVEAFRRAEERSIIVVFANCHGKAICATLKSLADIREKYLFIGIYNSPPSALTDTITQVADAVVFQSTAWNESAADEFLDRFPPSVRIVRIPAVTSLIFWPYYVQAPVKKDEEGRPLYRYAYGDRFIDQRVRAGRRSEEIVTEYMALNVPKAASLDRLMVAEGQKERAKELATDVLVRDWIEARFVESPMFHTPNHPTQTLINEITRQIVGHLDIAIDLDTLSVEEYPETSAVEHPIHPLTVEYLGLRYRKPEDAFRLSRGGLLTFPQFIPRYIEGSI